MYTYDKQINISMVGVATHKLVDTKKRGLYRWKWLHASYKSATCEYSLACCSSRALATAMGVALSKL